MKTLLNEVKDQYPGLTLKRLQSEFNRFFANEKLQGLFCREIALKKFKSLVKSGKPLQYINNEAYFYNSYLYVDERVLIPRYETEGLLELVLKELRPGMKVCEIGVGSGALMVALLKEINFSIQYKGGDISKDALEVANINFSRHHYCWNSKVELVESDRLASVDGERFDLIFSNPPYIKCSQKSLMHEQVTLYEPDMALFLKDDEHDEWFKVFFKQCSDLSSLLILEGHENNLISLKKIAKEFFNESLVKKDLTGRDRYLILKT